ncbi:hypothetical protein AOL_s00080g196 [Orbilia oligospora ATCC 24927]|uniref:CENP-V/GFA domain-containing protein n=1 Tax=Arthrobotrys oligospora (strain ATCC 24927 / CBS 115.81 / DSM 1491) TaxID=756982 RepID=G1XEG1_ARTOA|nr:hypothetical protein AOL_s00080g196 [Orbilia oligospora ATCC 24927]EGX48567.1 hypothetical protein AOL_s00080g196 [Orbilia oligospora ATCC 24927]
MSNPTPLQATCLCRTNTIQIPTTLPLTAHVCHCTTCRTSHGTLFAMHTDLEVLPFSESSPPSTFRVYQSSQDSGKAYFCGTCGTYMFASYFYMREGARHEGFCVSTGCVSLSDSYKSENPTTKLEDVLSVDFHCIIKDTIDGGASPWAGDWSKETQVQFHGNWEEPPMPSQEDAEELGRKYVYPAGRKELDGWCRCKNVKVRITREDTTKKYKTGVCACDSCRLATGTDVATYTWVPRDNAFFVTKSENGEEQIQEWPTIWDDATKAKFGNMIVFESTPGKVVWGACGTCGARIFYQRYGKTFNNGKDLVEPLTALFGADDTQGIMHLDFLDWAVSEDGIYWAEEAEKAGRAGIMTRNVNLMYQKWVKGLQSRA